MFKVASYNSASRDSDRSFVRQYCASKRVAVHFCQPGPPHTADFGNAQGCAGSSSKAKRGYRDLKVAMSSSICSASANHCCGETAFGGGGAWLGFGTPPAKCAGGGNGRGFGPSLGPEEDAMALHEKARVERKLSGEGGGLQPEDGRGGHESMDW